MRHAYHDLAFTPAVQAMQTRMGTRSLYAQPDRTTGGGEPGGQAARVRLSPSEIRFIEARDSFVQATVSETGWPYVQHRGGPVGFLKVLDETTIAYPDFRGNVQYISDGNLTVDDRVSLLLLDFAHQRRLKIMGHARLVLPAEDPALMARLTLPGYRARVERAVVITVAAFDWNCPQHITPRYTLEEIAAARDRAKEN